MTAATRTQLTTRNKVGLVIAGVLGLADLGGPSPAGVATLFFIPGYGVEPVEILVLVGFLIAALLGVATVVGVILTWAKGSRIAARVVAAARVVSLLMTSLIFLVREQGEGELAPWVFVIAAAVVILDVVAVILVLSRPATPTQPA